jgi:hypothetical protein
MIDDEQEPAPSAEESEELERLAALLTSSAHFELSPSALGRGRAELDQFLDRQESKRAQRRLRLRIVWPLPALLAGAFVIWLVLRPKADGPLPLSPELTVAQSQFLTAELTGAPVPRKDLDRATRRYRQDLLASLEAPR